MSSTRQEREGSPGGWRRSVFRSPIGLYRAGLGFVFGKRFVMLEHTGRISGQTRRTVLEVVVNDAEAVYVAAAWGEKAQWLRNVMANPSVVVHLGSRRFHTYAEMLDGDDAERLMAIYARAHPRAIRYGARFMLEDPGDTPEEQGRRVAEAVPMVRLAKRPTR